MNLQFRNEQIDFMAGELEEALQQLKPISGLNTPEFIIEDLEIPMINEVEILKTIRFTLNYYKDQQKLILSTTYSNQEIDASYLRELNKLDQSKSWINQILNAILKLKNVKVVDDNE